MTENVHLCTVPGAAESSEPFESSRRSMAAVPWSTLEKHLVYSHGWAINRAVGLKVQKDPNSRERQHQE